MIISPPFLPDRAQLSEEAWLDIAMAQPLSRLTSTGAPEGSFPLSLKLAWHNGMHIQAPQPDGNYLPARAIADGKVVYVHAPTTLNADVTHALNYNPFGDGAPSAAWTSDGFVVIRHTTEIGAAGTAPIEVSYFSAYMHLSHIANCPKRHAPWEAGDDIHRKDELGAPGRIYGHGGQIHFEICCDEANLRQFVPRAPAWSDPLAPVAPTADGRTDSVFGSMYVYLPAGTPTSAIPPSRHLRMATSVGASALPQPQWVQITYDMGSAILGSYTPSGEPIGQRCHAKDFEYNLYAQANERHGSLDAATQALSSPSGWYELLRFGRNLGPDPLPAHAAHWREIPTATGVIWADLNAPGTFKFSDADFLAFKGWNCFDDDKSPTDQRCDSLHMKTLIRDPDPRNDRRMEPEQLARRLGEPTVRAKLRRAICKFPSEWDQNTIAERYGWLQTSEFRRADDEATGARNWECFVKHARAISFPNLPAEFLEADWRFHPREFVGVMRTCGWLSASELAYLLPRHMFYTTSGIREAIVEPATTYELSLSTALMRLAQHSISISISLRKYLILSVQRQANFLAQVTLETAQWRSSPSNPTIELMHEWYFGKYSAENPMAQYYGPFYGRGIMQLTWVENYLNYEYFRSPRSLKNNVGGYSEKLTKGAPRITQKSLHWTGNPKESGSRQIRWAPRYDPNIIASDPYNACDSGGFYWVSKHHSGVSNINRVCDLPYTPITAGRVNVLVNGGGNGYHERQAYVAYLMRCLGDDGNFLEEAELTTPKGKIRVNFLKPRQ